MPTLEFYDLIDREGWERVKQEICSRRINK
jgi:hypothetical protein